MRYCAEAKRSRPRCSGATRYCPFCPSRAAIARMHQIVATHGNGPQVQLARTRSGRRCRRVRHGQPRIPGARHFVDGALFGSRRIDRLPSVHPPPRDSSNRRAPRRGCPCSAARWSMARGKGEGLATMAHEPAVIIPLSLAPPWSDVGLTPSTREGSATPCVRPLRLRLRGDRGRASDLSGACRADSIPARAQEHQNAASPRHRPRPRLEPRHHPHGLRHRVQPASKRSPSITLTPT